MKKFISFAILLCAVFGSASAQELEKELFDGYDNAHKYYEGARYIMQAMRNSGEDKETALDNAIIRLAPLYNKTTQKYISWYYPLKLTGVDVSAELPTQGLYTYKNACEMWVAHCGKRENSIARDIDTTDPTISGPKSRCRVKHIAIKANSSVCYEDSVKGTAIVVAIATPNSKICLTVEADETYTGTAYENGMVSYCKWEVAERSTVRYRIENLEDKDVEVAIIAN